MPADNVLALWATVLPWLSLDSCFAYAICCFFVGNWLLLLFSLLLSLFDHSSRLMLLLDFLVSFLTFLSLSCVFLGSFFA